MWGNETFSVAAKLWKFQTWDQDTRNVASSLLEQIKTLRSRCIYTQKIRTQETLRGI